jgi:hypothetical protein
VYCLPQEGQTAFQAWSLNSLSQSVHLKSLVSNSSMLSSLWLLGYSLQT